MKRRAIRIVGLMVALAAAAAGSLCWRIAAAAQPLPQGTASRVLAPWVYPGATRGTTQPLDTSIVPPETSLFGGHYHSPDDIAQVWRFYHQRKLNAGRRSPVSSEKANSWPSDALLVNFHEQRADGSGQSSTIQVRRPESGVALMVIRRPKETITVQLVPSARPQRGTEIIVLVDTR